MNGVTSMANSYFNSWAFGNRSGGMGGGFSAMSGMSSSSMSSLANIATQYNNLNANRASMTAMYRDMYKDTSKDDKFDVNDFLNGSSSSQASDALLKETKDLKESAKDLAATGKDSLFKPKEDGSYDMEKIAEAVGSFVKDYNKVVSSVSDSGNISILQRGSNLLTQTATNYNSLTKVGITPGMNGKLSVDVDKLKNADVKDLKLLFEGNNSYASKVANAAQNINQAAQSNQYKTYNNSGISSFSFANTLGNFVNYSA